MRSTDRYAPQPLPEQERIDAVLKRLATMSPAEILAASIRAGIHLPGGELAPEYRAQP